LGEAHLSPETAEEGCSPQRRRHTSMSFGIRRKAIVALALGSLLSLVVVETALAHHTRVSSATPSRVAFVVAYTPAALVPNGSPPPTFLCTAPFTTTYSHGSPLVAPSCGPTKPTSTTLTTGTAGVRDDGISSVYPPQMTGFVKIAVIADNPNTGADESDITVDSDITDVRCAVSVASSPCAGGVLSDYVGGLILQSIIRITDHYNAEDPNPATGCSGTTTCTATTAPIPFNVPMTCTAVGPAGDNTIGATCSAHTTVNTLAPGTVVLGRKGNTELGQVIVKDSGPSFNFSGATEFLKQGVYTK